MPYPKKEDCKRSQVKRILKFSYKTWKFAIILLDIVTYFKSFKKKSFVWILIDLSWLATVNLNTILSTLFDFCSRESKIFRFLQVSACSQYWAVTLLEKLSALSAEEESKLKYFFFNLSTFLLSCKIVYFSLKAKVKEFPSISAFRKQCTAEIQNLVV